MQNLETAVSRLIVIAEM